jgi:hypothetical protein
LPAAGRVFAVGGPSHHVHAVAYMGRPALVAITAARIFHVPAAGSSPHLQWIGPGP